MMVIVMITDNDDRDSYNKSGHCDEDDDDSDGESVNDSCENN